jgi:precorrin-2 dehydrogenase / sirohydrochlorin ferrochelatase
MPLFPAFLKLEGRRCLVVGAGAVSQEKIESLLRAGAKVRVVAPQATDRVRAWARARKIRWEPRRFRPADLAGAFLVVAATSSSGLHARIFRLARRRGVLCNAVDDPAHCDFYYGAVVRRGELQIAISTGGQSPALAQRLRKKLEKEIDAEYERFVTTLGAARKRLFAKNISPARRKALLHRLASEISFEKFLARRDASKK